MAADELHSTQQATSRAQGEQQSVAQQVLEVQGQLLAGAERREREARQHEEAKLASEQQIATLSEEAQLRTLSLSTTQNALALARTQLGAIADREHGVPSALTQLQVRRHIIGHARNNMQLNLSHAWL